MRMKAAILTLILLMGFQPLFAARRGRRHHPLTMVATAFARARKPTASGTRAHEGIAAADPRVLPLGTRIRVTGADGYSGNYLIADTGSAIKGRHIDLYMPSRAEAKQFGTKIVQVQIRHVGTGKEDARDQDEAMLQRRRGYR